MWKYEYIDHTADLGIEIVADTIEEIYSAALFVMFDNLVELERIDARKKFRIRIRGKSFEEILFNLLKKLLEDFYIKGVICKELKILQLKNNLLKAEIYGDIISGDDFPDNIFKYEIKAITYHNLEIKKIDNKYTVTIIFDI